MTNPKADNLLLFKSIADYGSFSIAAKNLNISNSQASKRMSYLEQTLGIKLLHRSTRKISLTAPGEMLYKKLASIKNQIDEAWESMLEYGNDPKGRLHITSSIYFGLHNLIPFTKEFSNQHPQIKIDLRLATKDNALEENTSYDIQFISYEMGPGELIPDANFCAKRIHSEALVTVAAKSYSDQHGRPTHPSELAKHKVLALYNNSKKPWKFYENNTLFTQPVDVAFETNTYEALYKAAKAGMGIALVPKRLVDTDKDDMVILFGDFTQQTLDTYAYYSRCKTTSKKISLVLEELTQNKKIT